jgi:hypothetical protein
MRLIAFLQAWDLLREELGREPSLEEYAERFVVRLETAAEQRAECESAFPGVLPGEVLHLLWRWRESRVKRRDQLPMRSG